MRTVIALLAATAWTSIVPASAQVLDLREMNTDQIRALDRQKTAVIIPGGILEEHGPYLPSYTDGYVNERLARDLADAIVARPGWAAVMFPPIPLGSGGANEIGGKYSFPGTYAVRPATLRSVFMDLAADFGEQGFRWVFVVHGHGSPDHNRMLDQAGAFFHDTYGGQMVHLRGFMEAPDCCRAGPDMLSPAAKQEDGFSVHADIMEHARILYLRPDLVPASIAQAPARTARNFADLVELARADGWPGYFGAPAYATAAIGAANQEDRARRLIAAALKVLDGWDPADQPRYGDMILKVDPAVRGVIERSRRHDDESEARQRAWLASKGLQ
jgi:creatinine amidohydrolase/Fe(II)-dependent formamide hydrolase-like protein